MTSIFSIIAIVLLVVITITIISSCKNKGKKNRIVSMQNSPVTSFSSISIEGTFPVELSQSGENEWVKVEADDKLQELILVHNDGDQLIIEMKEDVSLSKTKKVKVYINFKNIHELNFNSVGNLNNSGILKLDSLELNSESVGKLDLNLEGKFLRANLKSVGVTNLSGIVDEVRINNKSIGALHAYGLKAKNLMIHNTSVGIAEVYADSTFHIRSSAIGNLYYKGPGAIKELNSEGIGKVEQRN